MVDEPDPAPPVHTLGPQRCLVCAADGQPDRVREVEHAPPPAAPQPRRTTEATAPVPAVSCMVCLDIPDDVAAALAVPGGLPAGELHVTLAYLGKTLTDEQRAQVADIVGQVAAVHPPLAGQLGGIGQFPPGEDGVPVWAPVDVPGLAELRHDLVARLATAGLPVDGERGYTPHMTLTYLAAGDTPPPPVPPTPVAFDALTWTRGPDWTAVPLAAAAADSRKETSVTTESTDRVPGRVIEAKGVDPAGGRIFRVRIIQAGESRNKRRYPQPVLAAAARLYEGAKAYDHHRTEEELRSSTITGLVGSYRDVTVEADGLYADLHLLPGATHAAQALDAALQAQEAGLEPLVGISHDVLATWAPPTTEGGTRVEEATAIVRVFSADIVADPAAGGRATRMVAGGIDTTDNQPAGRAPDGESKESHVTAPLDTAAVLAALKDASDEQLAAAGLSKAAPPGDTGAGTAATGEAGGGTATTAGATESTQRTLEATTPKTSFLGQLMIRTKVEGAGLPIAVVESVTATLPDQVTESAVDAQIAAIKGGLAIVERAGLVGAPTLGGATVTKESREKKSAALDAFFDGDYHKGYRSFREAWADVTGYRPQAWGEDVNRKILRECFGSGFDSDLAGAARGTESLTSGSWAEVLGDSITRRMIKLYDQPSLQSWRKVVSDVVPVSDFRQQKRTRIGGYGTLPVVAEGASYLPLTSPTDEEALYAVIKRGGTEDLTLETIANDDIGAVRNIPRLLGLAAAITLYRFVWDILATNVVCSYDTVALFAAGHNNTDNPALLGPGTLSAARAKMRKQAAYGNAANILSLTPKTLVVPSALEELAFQLCTSAVAITAGSDATVPNMHRGLDYEVLDYVADVNDWFLVADPNMCPTIEVGFYQGRERPELFTQADANTGSMFNADKYTYKIRHTYSGTPLEHRGFYRGANA
ncbi:2'-5' RNA ligase family protein [Micromonospora sp. NPDC050200]|uniref:2'-5' RNA ligase family protein n=1 Tax=Micromonospora sp. NPDC050200 TaxID=3155664 RepID=UPI0033DCFF9A